MTKDHYQLVTYSQGVVGDWEKKNGIASFLSPEVVVGGGLFYYKDYGYGNAFTPIEMRRALGGPVKMLSISVTDQQDTLQEYGLGTFIDDQEREMNPNTYSVLEQRKMTDLVNTVMNNNLFLTLASARTLTNHGTGGDGAITGVTGVWSNTANDPVNEINLTCKYITDTYGVTPNKIYFDSKAWILYQNNPNVRGRFQGVLVQAVTPENTTQLWNIPLNAKINQGALYEGGAGKADVIIFFSEEGLSQFDISFMKTFVAVPGRFTRVRSWRDEDVSSDKYKVQWFQKIKVTGYATAARLVIS